MNSIVKELAAWTMKNAQELRDNGVEVRANIPDPGSNVPWKASIELKAVVESAETDQSARVTIAGIEESKISPRHVVP